MKMILIRNGRHMRPMLAVVTRYNIGKLDPYERGRWITECDIPIIKNKMREDRTFLSRDGKEMYVQGTNMHNYVSINDFIELFK